MAASNTREQSSLSSYASARATHVHLDWSVDFSKKQLQGKVTLDVLAVTDVNEVVLDTNHLEVHGASVNGATAEFVLAEVVEPFGRALTVRLPASVSANSTFKIAVDYNTTEESAALQWLNPEQTAGKTHPYLFTQCQAIHARSLLPCQDTPFVKTTYSAAVTAPKPLTAVMSALKDGETTDSTDGSSRTFRFKQPVPTPSYLIALGVGNLASRDIGPRSTVWAEPSVVDDAAWEFAETEDFLAKAEEIVGPYVWGRYDLLMLPPSFPYGGMENPCLTFVTPTLIAKDRSLADVVAHEIAHSWTGNLVSPSTWNHFWINEGWTMMLQRLMIARLKGEASLEFDSFSGAGDMEDSIQMFMTRGQPEFTKLVPDLTGLDPDDAFSSVPYEKGYYLIYYLRNLVGKENFERFFHDYIQAFKFRSITSEDFKNYFVAYFSEGRHTLPRVSHRGVPPTHNNDVSGFNAADIAGLAVVSYTPIEVPATGIDDASALAAAKAHAIDVSSVDWNAWFYGEGMPPVKNAYDASARGKVDAHAALWVENPAKAAEEAAAVTSSWQAMHWIAFMEKLVGISSEYAAMSPAAIIDPAVLRAIDAKFNLASSRNAEIRMMWSQLAVRSGMQDRLSDVIAFLTSQGRMKYVRPLFRELLRVSFGRDAALELFKSHGNAYHPICRKMVAVDIEKETATPAVDPSTHRKLGGSMASSEPSSAGGVPTANEGVTQVSDHSEDEDADDADVEGLDEDDEEGAANATRRTGRFAGRQKRRKPVVRIVRSDPNAQGDSSSAPLAYSMPESSTLITKATPSSAPADDTDEYAAALEKREMLLNVYAEKKAGMPVAAAVAKVRGASNIGYKDEDDTGAEVRTVGITDKLRAVANSVGEVKVPAAFGGAATVALAAAIIGGAILGATVFYRRAA